MNVFYIYNYNYLSYQESADFCKALLSKPDNFYAKF